jgi:VWFA-related protein
MRSVAAVTLAGVIALGTGSFGQVQSPGESAPAQTDQKPVFKSGVDLIRLDVTAVTRDGTPVDDLTSEDFEVRVKGRVRPVVTSRFLSLMPDPLGGSSGASLSATRDFTSNDLGVEGRLFVIAVDQDSLPTGAGRPVMLASLELLKSLGPADRVALVAIPQPGVRVEFTRDVGAIERGLQRITGRRPSRVRPVRINFDEAQAIESRNQTIINTVVERECFLRSDETCPDQLFEEAREVLHEQREHLQVSLTALSGLADSLGGIDGPKTVVYFSGGLGYESRSLARFREVAERAAEARLTLYALHVDTFGFGPTERAPNAAFMGDNDAGLHGLETLTGLTGGVLFRGVGRSTEVFERIARESGGLYVLGVEPEAGSPAAEPLDVDVRVKRPGITVRTPQVVIPAPSLPSWSNPKRAIGFTLRQPRPASELPLRLSSYTFRGTHPRRLRTVIAAELALSVAAAADLAWGYEILYNGRVVSDAFDYGLPPASTATADAVVLVTACELPPGEYTLRFAAMDAVGRRGSVEHPLTVGLRVTDLVQFSDLLVGDSDQSFSPRLEFGPASNHLSALLELYATELVKPDQLTVEFDLRGLDGMTRASRRVDPVATGSDQRRTASTQLPLDNLSAGSYVLRAQVLVSGRPVGSVRRQVVVN